MDITTNVFYWGFVAGVGIMNAAAIFSLWRQAKRQQSELVDLLDRKQARIDELTNINEQIWRESLEGCRSYWSTRGEENSAKDLLRRIVGHKDADPETPYYGYLMQLKEAGAGPLLAEIMDFLEGK